MRRKTNNYCYLRICFGAGKCYWNGYGMADGRFIYSIATITTIHRTIAMMCNNWLLSRVPRMLILFAL